MRKLVLLSIVLLFVMGLLSGCIITDNNYDEYERQQFQSTDTISEIEVVDISTDVMVKTSNGDAILVEYSDSLDNPWYSIEIVDEVLEIKKTRGTVGIEDNTLVISIPEKEYSRISIETTNGDIVFNSISSLAYKCTTENGDIKGLLAGKESDYLIVTTVKNGNSNMNNNVIQSSNIIEFDVKNGDIDIEFSE